MSALRVVIVGAGIGGLTAAIALRRAGHDPIVLERAPELKPVGAGLTVQPNALLALRRVGLDRAVQEAGASCAIARIVHWRGGDLAVQRMDALAPEPGLLPVMIHRHTLHDVLRTGLGDEHLRLGAEVAGFEDDGARVRVRLVDGETVECDLLVGADGIKSVVRAALLGDGPPRYAGYTCWRGITARAEWPTGESAEIWGPGRRMGIVPVDGDRIYWFAVLNAPEGGRDPAGGGRAAAEAVVADCAGPAGAIVASTPEEAVLRNDICDRPPSKVWGRGRVTLLGDAAHAMTPNMGQGACQAIEDAAVLGHLLAEGDPVAALRRYETVRRERTRWFVEQSWSIGRVAQWESGVARWARDLGVRWAPESAVRRNLERAWAFSLPPS